MLQPIPAQGLLTGFTKHNGLWRLKGPRCGISTREVGRCAPVFPAPPDRARKGPWKGARAFGRPAQFGRIRGWDRCPSAALRSSRRPIGAGGSNALHAHALGL